jgi:hypothetical protein
MSMSARVTSLRIVLRGWKRGSGLEETEVKVQSLEELYDMCLKTPQQDVVDRVIIEGVADDGGARTVTLAFQSASGL